MKSDKNQKRVNYKQYFVAFYKGYAHHCFYSPLVLDESEVRDYVRAKYGEVRRLVIDQVI